MTNRFIGHGGINPRSHRMAIESPAHARPVPVREDTHKISDLKNFSSKRTTFSIGCQINRNVWAFGSHTLLKDRLEEVVHKPGFYHNHPIRNPKHEDR